VASTELATGFVSLAVSTRGMGAQIARGFQSADQEADKAGKRAGKRFGGAMGGLARAGIVGAVAGAGIAAVKGLSTAIDEAREAQKVGATTAQIIKSTGGAAKVSAAQVESLAGAISRKAGVDDEAIQKGANLLLTFKNVRNEAGKGGAVFDRATQSAVDLSAAGFGSVENASKMLGKALNDPVKGISALSRAGVTFTDQQKEQIKTLIASGRTLDAQKIILGEVESKVGGVAAASATAGEKMSVAFGNLAEQIGTAALPLLDKFGDLMVNKVVPALSRAVTFLTENVGPAFASIKNTIAPLTAGLGGLSLSLRSTGEAGGFITTTLIPALQGVVSAGRGLAAVVLPIIRQIAAAFVQSWPQIKTVVTGVFETARGIVVDVMAIIAQAVRIGTHLISVLWAKNGAGIIRAVKGTFGGIVRIIGGAMKIVGGIVKLVLAAITGDKKKAMAAWKQIWSGIKNVIVGIWRVLKNTVVALLRTLLSEIMTKWKGLLSWVSTTLKRGLARIRDYILDPVRNARDKLKSILDQVANRFTSGVNAIARAWNALKAKAKEPIKFIVNTVINDGLIDAFNQIAKKVGAGTLARVSLPKGFAVGGWTGPGPKLKPAGIVHADEHVWTKEEMRRFPGGHRAMERLRKRIVHGDTRDLPGYWIGGGVRPVRGGRDNRHSGYGRARWAGDLTAGHGARVGAWKAGQVSSVRHMTTSYGKHVRINHGGEQTLYAHLSRIAVNAGQRVRQNQTIGNVGNTGNSFGPHLHFELSGGGRRIGSGNGSGALDAVTNTVTRVINWGKRLKGRLSGALGKLSGAGSTPFAELAKGVARKASAALYEKGKNWTQTIVSRVKGAVGNLVDRLKGAVGRGRPGAAAAARRLGASPVSYHNDPSGLPSFDAMIRNKAMGNAVAGHILGNRGKYGLRYLIWNMRIWSARNWGGRPYRPITNTGDYRHVRHVHATFDQGGYLKPGLTVARNLTGQREKVLNPVQTRAWERGQSGGGDTYHVYGLDDANARRLLRQAETMRRQRETLQPSPMI
jgi:murein DD-endopeptidase MepM/ murein hydrolase activator NlpD